MVADAEIVRDRESRIRRYVADLRDMSAISDAAFLENRERQYAVLHALQLAIKAAVEIATHICAADNLGMPSSYAEAFDLLENARVVDRALADDLRRMAWTLDSCTVCFKIGSGTSTGTWWPSSSTSIGQRDPGAGRPESSFGRIRLSPLRAAEHQRARGGARQGIIHRDRQPPIVALTADGRSSCSRFDVRGRSSNRQRSTAND